MMVDGAGNCVRDSGLTAEQYPEDELRGQRGLCSVVHEILGGLDISIEPPEDYPGCTGTGRKRYWKSAARRRATLEQR